jgi:NAD(P)-dependent dehydrogenase (short-subunit alcohol dehydrogenase family)
MSKVLDGKTALVTGGSRGLGRAMVQRLAASGALVAINYAYNAEAAHETLRAIEAESGQGFVLHAELGGAATADALAAALEAELLRRTGEPGLDILINNVGGGVGGGFKMDLESITPEFYDATVASTMSATFWVTRAMKRLLRDGGRVINIGSVAARLALNAVPVYAMSKTAVNTFTVIMAKELSPRGITVNCVVPGMTLTDRVAPGLADPNVLRYFETNALMGRLGQPDDIATVVHDLTTPSWGWVTGQIIESSGGYML